jgi:hypothetical protein
MAMKTGDFFTNILLAAAPTALGRALAHLPATTQDWDTGMIADNKPGKPNIEDASVVTEFHNRLTNAPTQAIFAALLTTVYLQVQQQDGSVQYQPTTLAKVLNDQIAGLGNTQGFLNVPWSQPPHPPGRFVWRLIDTLSGYDEQ